MSTGFSSDPDDFFKDTRMSFGDHIEELRQHLWRAIYGFLFALLFSFFLGKTVMDFITAPVKSQLDAFYERRLTKVLAEKREQLTRLTKATPFRKVYFLRDQLNAIGKGERAFDERRPVVQTEQEEELERNPLPRWKRFFFGNPRDASDAAMFEDYQGETRKIPEAQRNEQLVSVWMSVDNPLFFAADGVGPLREILQIDSPTTLRAEEAFFVWFKVCLVTGFVIGSPWIFWQVWMFVAAGLYPQEKRLVHFYLPISLLLFFVGVVICEMFVIPKALEALLWFNEWLGFKPDIRLNDWLGFAIWMPVVFGLSFQTPLVMLFLHRLGIMTPEGFAGKRSYAWFAMALFAAMVTPSVDAFSMLFLWLPMGLLYELGIFLMRFSPPPGDPLDEDARDPDELVEV
ncbi:MAG: twin-arginine translocase subunit TatC [Gemmataceae bacterium]